MASIKRGLCLFLLLWSALALGQSYPAKPVRIIVAVGPGGGDDFAARTLAAKLTEIISQQFFVENKPGAGGMIGQTYVAKSAPDGYTLLLAGGSMAGAKYVNANMGYDLLRDFTPVSLLETSPFALIANPALPAKTVQELVTYGRANPGKLTYATLGAGQIPYWGVVLFNSMAGIQAVEVQYKGPADAMLDIIAGRVDYFVAPVVSALGGHVAGALRVAARRASHRGSRLARLRHARVAQHHGPGRYERQRRAGAEPRHRACGGESGYAGALRQGGLGGDVEHAAGAAPAL